MVDIDLGGYGALPHLADTLWWVIQPRCWQGRRVVIPLLLCLMEPVYADAGHFGNYGEALTGSGPGIGFLMVAMFSMVSREMRVLHLVQRHGRLHQCGLVLPSVQRGQRRAVLLARDQGEHRMFYALVKVHLPGSELEFCGG